jgi:transposase InsO family protein
VVVVCAQPADAAPLAPVVAARKSATAPSQAGSSPACGGDAQSDRATGARDVERRGRAPELIRCDNGPEFISQALRDWCRFAGATTGYIEPGAPWQNPFVESFNGHLRRELLEMESFNSLFEAQLLLEDWRLEYNHYRPHQSLNYQSPAEYAHRWRTDNQPELS